MTPTRGSLLSKRSGARELGDEDVAAALAVCRRDPVASVLATTRLEDAAQRGLRAAGGRLWGFIRDDALVGICWVGANLVPVLPAGDEEAVEAVARLARAHGRWYSSVVGPAEVVLPLWARLEEEWRAREVRPDQPSMAIAGEPLVAPDTQVRPSRPAEYGVVLPACVRMFTEEVGYSPVSGPAGPYEQRVRTLVERGRSYVRITHDAAAEPRVVFKAEIGAVGGGVAQVQGVWVDPQDRGRHLSEPGMAAVVRLARERWAPTVSLYVNAYNHRAVAAYERVGFRQVGTYATVLF
ncbi:DUF4081 domain-containing GNAT family N-acetyltransferase [Cellulomonas marina]|uniref:N-acetyltransferase domain-containing protein n=1 Tax=Cellulomonas marina TaxID=988821 RepID=A0A1I0VGC5_9CELL|nr:DUF4081 domain-containing GNAT family N-acetyltransferase [Cellulomonas marina]GIG27982.1 acetyltransferase [Cellulomonas marina]SFA75424.1 hypothetical protein SAMN05421867_101379 [Cellulomonas marina]